MCDHIPNVPVRFDCPIPEGDYPYIPVLRPKCGERLKVIVTSREVVGCMTHWIGGRTRPCYAPFAPCRGCKEYHARGWKGYLGGVCYFTKVKVIVMLTPHACRPWIRRLRGDPPGLRGCLLTSWHEDGARCGKLRIDLSEKPLAGAIPEPFSVEAALMHMWAMAAAKTDPDSEQRWEMIPIPGE